MRLRHAPPMLAPYHGAASFLRAPAVPTGQGRPVGILGVPFDLSTCYRPGARFGPAAVRACSAMFTEDDDFQTGTRPSDAYDVFDVGDVPIIPAGIGVNLAAIQAAAATLHADGAHPIAIGGDHLITLPLLRAARAAVGQPLALVHFDAHCDTWEGASGAADFHGSPMRTAILEGLIDPRATVQIGLRSPVAREVAAWTCAQGVTSIAAMDVLTCQPAGIAGSIRALVGDRPAYFTFDIDVLDPSQAPGVSTPEVAGIWTWQALAIIRAIAGLRFVGADVVEVCPPYDQSDITAFAAMTVLWTYLVARLPG